MTDISHVDLGENVSKSLRYKKIRGKMKNDCSRTICLSGDTAAQNLPHLQVTSDNIEQEQFSVLSAEEC